MRDKGQHCQSPPYPASSRLVLPDEAGSEAPFLSRSTAASGATPHQLQEERATTSLCLQLFCPLICPLQNRVPSLIPAKPESLHLCTESGRQGPVRFRGDQPLFFERINIEGTSSMEPRSTRPCVPQRQVCLLDEKGAFKCTRKRS
jgi:hypothetical protein